MGTIISKIEQLDRIRWTQLRKGRVVKANRVLAVDDTQVIIWVKGKEQIIVRDSDEEMEEAGGGGASGAAAHA